MKQVDRDMAKSLGFLADDEDLLLAIVFGSASQGTQRPDSDIDVAVYPRHTMNRYKRQSIADQIAEATGRSVDLIDLSAVNGSLLRRILHTGRVVFARGQAPLGMLTEKLLDWQEDFEPQINQLLEVRLKRFAGSSDGT